MKKSLYLSLCLSLSLTLSLTLTEAYAQKLQNNNFYIKNPFSFNTAYAGMDDKLYFAAQFSGQNTELPSSPQTGSLYIRKGFNQIGGVGLRASYDQRGVFRRTQVQVGGSYTAIFSELNNNKLHIGISVGADIERVDIESIENSEHTNLSDPMLFSNNLNTIDIQFGAGLVYQIAGFNLGISAPVVASIYRSEQQLTSILQNLSVLASYTFDLDDFRLRPLFMMQDFTSDLLLFDGGLYFDVKDRFWGQAIYRTNNTAVIGLGLDLIGMGIGYNIEVPFGGYGSLAGVSHAIILQYTIDAGNNGSGKRKRKNTGSGIGKGRKKASEEAEEN